QQLPAQREGRLARAPGARPPFRRRALRVAARFGLGDDPDVVGGELGVARRRFFREPLALGRGEALALDRLAPFALGGVRLLAAQPLPLRREPLLLGAGR